MQQFSSNEVYLEALSAKWRPFCSSANVLTDAVISSFSVLVDAPLVIYILLNIKLKLMLLLKTILISNQQTHLGLWLSIRASFIQVGGGGQGGP